MTKNTESVLIIAAAVLVCALGLSTASLADKTTIDPNTVRSSALPKAADKRLDQKITYQSLDKRLHSVLDDLSTMTGVAIRCGDGRSNWQVRDLPVVVCARDLPLGKLLRAVADGTHLLMTSSEKDGVRTYRIWRDRARKKQIEDYFAKHKAAAQARPGWEWDTWTQLGRTQNLVDAAKGLDTRGRDFDPKACASFAGIMAQLGPDAREKASKDGKLCLRPKGQPAAMATAILRFYRASWDWWQKDARKLRRLIAEQHPEEYTKLYPNGEPEDKPFPESSAQNMSLVIDVSADEWGGVSSHFEGPCESGSPPTDYPPDLVKKCLKDWPEEPQYPDPIETSHEGNLAAPDWASPLMQAQPKIEKPKDKKTLTFADGLSLISKAAGISIVCEDFVSHKNRLGDQLGDLYPRINVGCAIQNLTNGQYAWRLDEPDRLVVGSSREWYRRHDRLVPESLIAHLISKLNGDGVELDDVVPIVHLTDGQREDWILESRELQGIKWYLSKQDAPFWRLYDSLSLEDKALAKSEIGLKLAKCNPAALIATFAEAATALRTDPTQNTMRVLELNPALRDRIRDVILESHPELNTADEKVLGRTDMAQVLAEAAVKLPELAAPAIPTDMESILAMAMRIKKQGVLIPARAPGAGSGSPGYQPEPVKESFEKYQYYMTLEWGGRSLRISGPGLIFPLYSPEREKKLWEEKQKAAKHDAAVTTN